MNVFVTVASWNKGFGNSAIILVGVGLNENDLTATYCYQATEMVSRQGVFAQPLEKV